MRQGMSATEVPTLYFGGNIHGQAFARLRDAAQRFRPYAEQMGFHVVTPLDDKREEDRDRYDPAFIVEGDIALMSISRVIILNFWEPSIGTSCEMCIASRELRLPVIACIHDAGLLEPRPHFWLSYHCQDLLDMREIDWQTVAAEARDHWLLQPSQHAMTQVNEVFRKTS